VFVASKVRCATAGSKHVALHPLLFSFAARTPVYPTRLTAVDNGACAIDLYVFGKRRATARHFDAVRCDRLASNLPSNLKRGQSGLRISEPEILALVSGSTVGTKLSARLSPKQMASDVDIRSGVFWRKGATVFSYSGALTIALNVALPLAVLGWLLAGASQGGWKVTEKSISRSRWCLLVAAAGTGLAVFLLLPKVEVVSGSAFPQEEGRADGRLFADVQDRAPGNARQSSQPARAGVRPRTGLLRQKQSSPPILISGWRLTVPCRFSNAQPGILLPGRRHWWE
jgi:hypothetical protein